METSHIRGIFRHSRSSHVAARSVRWKKKWKWSENARCVFVRHLTPCVFPHIACGFQMAAVLLYTFDELMVVSCAFGPKALAVPKRFKCKFPHIRSRRHGRVISFNLHICNVRSKYRPFPPDSSNRIDLSVRMWKAPTVNAKSNE